MRAAVARFVELIEALGEVAHYLHAAFGKFPATLPSVYVRVYAQAQHVDFGYYDAVFGPDAVLDTHRQYLTHWHD